MQPERVNYFCMTPSQREQMIEEAKAYIRQQGELCANDLHPKPAAGRCQECQREKWRRKDARKRVREERA